MINVSFPDEGTVCIMIVSFVSVLLFIVSLLTLAELKSPTQAFYVTCCFQGRMMALLSLVHTYRSSLLELMVVAILFSEIE